MDKDTGYQPKSGLDTSNPPKGKVIHKEQPMPIIHDGDDIQSMVILDIEHRREVGIERYGTPLQANNGRDALRDAYEEALDLSCYLKQAIVERDGISPVLVGVDLAGIEPEISEFVVPADVVDSIDWLLRHDGSVVFTVRDVYHKHVETVRKYFANIGTK